MSAQEPPGRAEGPPSSRPAGDHPDALQSLTRVLLTSDPGADRIRRSARDIGHRLLRASPYACGPDFRRLHTDDLSFLFAAYDERFLNGLCGKLLGPDGVTFRLSSRMSRAGGKTTRLQGPAGTRFEIAIATSILFDGFVAGDPEVTVCGLPCRHRLDALQRLFEHELVHLAEWLCWLESHCGRERFQGIAHRLFLHRAHTHQLITRSVRAARLGITAGTRVTFRYRGQRLRGRVNRVTKRATVLVEDPTGERWSDGRHYVQYYVPLAELRLADRPGDSGGTGTTNLPL